MDLWEQAFGPSEPPPEVTMSDIHHAVVSGIAALETYVNSGEHFDDGIGFMTTYDDAEMEQANWFFGLAWDSLADLQGFESDAWNEQGRNG